MSLLVVRAERDSAPEVAPAAELLNAIGLTAQLPERLMRDAAGRSFEPVQLNPNQEVLPQVTLVMRREPVGGAEVQIRENAHQVQDLALGQLNRMLAGAAFSTRSFLQDLLTEARARKHQLAIHTQQVEQTYTRLQERLHRWQDQAGQRSGSLGADLWRWLVGGRERLSLPEVLALWNQRESLAANRAAAVAALEISTWFLDTIQDLLTHLDELLAQARRLHTAAESDAAQLRLPLPLFAPWTVQVDARVVVDALLGQIDPDGLVVDLLRGLTAAGGAATLADQVQELARREAERRLAALSITDLIELEARAAGMEPDDDTLVLVGQGLLDALSRPTWQVTRSARPRIETLQVTPDGTPAYSLDGLSSAAYGTGQDRLGFVEVQLGVAKDELTLVRDGDDAFQNMLQQRNLYVLEEMAYAWESAHTPPDPAPSPGAADYPQPLNGRLAVPAETTEQVHDA